MNPARTRVVVAMSGGVDSSVAAALLAKADYQVEGLMLRLWSEPASDAGGRPENRCCTPSQLADAQSVAQTLGIPFRTLDAVELFRSTVVESYIGAHAAGLTPNPCVVCNRRVRFGFLLDQVRDWGAQYLATGHYVRVQQSGPSYQILRGADAAKDQSYVLYSLNQSRLPHLLFPLGDYTKAEVRALAREFGLPVADKADSQDVCFLADGDYRRFLRQQAPDAMRPGPILDLGGNVVGKHQGLAAYTIGQRKRLGISAPSPLYVLATDPARNALVVGPRNALGRRTLTTVDTRWVAGRPPAGDTPFQAEIKIRYRGRLLPAAVTPGKDGKATARFEETLSDITPGQAAVFYQGSTCLGGGTIAPWEEST